LDYFFILEKFARARLFKLNPTRVCIFYFIFCY